MGRLTRAFSVLALVAGGCIALSGCGESAATERPPVTGKVPDWKNMTKEQKIANINGQHIPDDAKKSAIDRIDQGLD